MQRIKESDLKDLIDQLNELTGNPLTYSSHKPDEPFKSNIGHYHLSCAYGGYRLDQLCNEGGGIRVISCNGYSTKRDLYNELQAMLYGIRLGVK